MEKKIEENRDHLISNNTSIVNDILWSKYFSKEEMAILKLKNIYNDTRSSITININ